MSTGFPLIDMAGQAGDALGLGLLGFQQGREAKRKSRGEEAIAAFAAGDHARALQLAKEADAVQGLAGPLSPPREAPALKGTMTTQPGVPLGAAPSPRGLAASMPTPGTPTPAFGLGLDLGNAASLPTSLTPPAEPNMGLAGLAQYQPTAAPVTVEDKSRPDWSDAGNIEAARKFVGAPLPKPMEISPGASLYDPSTRQAVYTAPYPVNPNRMTPEETAALRREGWDAAMDRTKYTVGATGERQDKAIGAASARQDKGIAAGDRRQAATIGAAAARQQASFGQQGDLLERRIEAGQETAETKRMKGEIAKRSEAAAIAGRVISKAFPWVGAPTVHQETGDIALAVPKTISPSQLRQLENAAIDLGGFLMEQPGQAPRIVLNTGSTAAGVKAKLADPKLTWARAADGTETRVADQAGVARAPRPQKMPNFTKDALDVFKSLYPYGFPGKDAAKKEEMEAIEQMLVAKWKARTGQGPAPAPTPSSGITANDLLRAAEKIQAERERGKRINGGK